VGSGAWAAMTWRTRAARARTWVSSRPLGLPVPAGFVVGAPAYAAFCAQTGLRERLAELLDDVDVADTAALQGASSAARELFDATVIPGPLVREIRSAYAQLVGADPDAPVAVRSSATAEDTASTSFAGMNETFLNIRGADAVADAVRRCWRSLFGARAIYYRGVNGFGQADMDIAVVVQCQVNSTRAGVMFTGNPVTGEAGELVIEGSFGLGEAVVSGSVSPDRYWWTRGRSRSAVVRFTTRIWSSSTPEKPLN
jgi:pyruvate, water dikinase